MNETYYAAYGSEGHPFVGGWTVIHAPNYDLAVEVFRAVHPNVNGMLACSEIYPEADFKRTKMATNGNHGRYAHEVIDLQVSQVTASGNV